MITLKEMIHITHLFQQIEISDDVNFIRLPKPMGSRLGNGCNEVPEFRFTHWEFKRVVNDSGETEDWELIQW